METDSKGSDKESKMDKNDYYNTSVPKEFLETRNDIIQKRWDQLHGLLTKHTDEIIKYLLYVNAGGVVTILAFMGTSESIRNSIYLQIALLCYALALMCVGILRVLLLLKIERVFNSWRRDANKYWKQHIGFSELTEEDDNRTESGRAFWIVGWISGGLSIIGLIFGGIGLFGQC